MACSGSGPCAVGHVWAGEPTGKNESLAGLDTYVALPSNGETPRGVVLLITDIFGAHRKNPKLWADRLAAAADFAVVLPDFFRGDAWPADEALSPDGFKAWLARHPKEKILPEAQAVVEEAAKKFSSDLKNPLPVSVVGFCWGALYATLLAGGPNPSVASAALLHPSLLTLDEFKAVEAAPLLVLFTANDQQVSDAFRAEIVEVLDAKSKEKKPPTSHHFYADQAHGFSLRGDDTDPKIAAAAGDAFERTAAWLRGHGTAK